MSGWYQGALSVIWRKQNLRPIQSSRVRLDEHPVPGDGIGYPITRSAGVLVQELNANYADVAPVGGLDAEERNALLDVLSRHFTGQPWPRSAAWMSPGGSWSNSKTP